LPSKPSELSEPVICCFILQFSALLRRKNLTKAYSLFSENSVKTLDGPEDFTLKLNPDTPLAQAQVSQMKGDLPQMRRYLP